MRLQVLLARLLAACRSPVGGRHQPVEAMGVARACALRQLAGDHQITSDLERGIAPELGCRTCQCSQGAKIRAALEASGTQLSWRSVGCCRETRRFRSDVGLQLATRERLRLAGALEEVPDLDNPPMDELEEAMATPR